MLKCIRKDIKIWPIYWLHTVLWLVKPTILTERRFSSQHRYNLNLFNCLLFHFEFVNNISCHSINILLLLVIYFALVRIQTLHRAITALFVKWPRWEDTLMLLSHWINTNVDICWSSCALECKQRISRCWLCLRFTMLFAHCMVCTKPNSAKIKIASRCPKAIWKTLFHGRLPKRRSIFCLRKNRSNNRPRLNLQIQIFYWLSSGKVNKRALTILQTNLCCFQLFFWHAALQKRTSKQPWHIWISSGALLHTEHIRLSKSRSIFAFNTRAVTLSELIGAFLRSSTTWNITLFAVFSACVWKKPNPRMMRAKIDRVETNWFAPCEKPLVWHCASWIASRIGAGKSIANNPTQSSINNSRGLWLWLVNCSNNCFMAFI